eukprot:GHVS01090393.1.p1 GENE.GHVS01090393.1~~GHVS01090393.1.p1  ORF type:complete len:105 (-),score=4.91 GHVS01090393.1:1423-1737(-)
MVEWSSRELPLKYKSSTAVYTTVKSPDTWGTDHPYEVVLGLCLDFLLGIGALDLKYPFWGIRRMSEVLLDFHSPSAIQRVMKMFLLLAALIQGRSVWSRWRKPF